MATRQRSVHLLQTATTALTLVGVVSANCYLDSALLCCTAANQTVIEHTPCAEFCKDIIMSNPYVPTTVDAKQGESGQTGTTYNGTMNCVIQPRHCVLNYTKCANLGPPETHYCYSNVVDENSAFCDGEVPD